MWEIYGGGNQSDNFGSLDLLEMRPTPTSRPASVKPTTNPLNLVRLQTQAVRDEDPLAIVLDLGQAYQARSTDFDDLHAGTNPLNAQQHTSTMTVRSLYRSFFTADTVERGTVAKKLDKAIEGLVVDDSFTRRGSLVSDEKEDEDELVVDLEEEQEEEKVEVIPERKVGRRDATSQSQESVVQLSKAKSKSKTLSSDGDDMPLTPSLAPLFAVIDSRRDLEIRGVIRNSFIPIHQEESVLPSAGPMRQGMRQEAEHTVYENVCETVYENKYESNPLAGMKARLKKAQVSSNSLEKTIHGSRGSPLTPRSSRLKRMAQTSPIWMTAPLQDRDGRERYSSPSIHSQESNSPRSSFSPRERYSSPSIHSQESNSPRSSFSPNDLPPCTSWDERWNGRTSEKMNGNIKFRATRLKFESLITKNKGMPYQGLGDL